VRRAAARRSPRGRAGRVPRAEARSARPVRARSWGARPPRPAI